MSQPEVLHLACPHCHALNRAAPERLREQPKCGRCHQFLFVGQPMTLDTASFEAHAQRSDLPLVVDFWAAWCGPCRAMAPAFAAATAQLEPRARFAKLDTEAEPALAARYAIRTIPTMLLLQHGRELARISGALPVASIIQWVNRHVVG